MRPLIGVTTSELRPSGLATTRRHGEPAHPEMALGMTYVRTLDAAGAIPVVLPPVGTDHLMPLIELGPTEPACTAWFEPARWP
jgi:putative glutamine amidotransferase